MKTPTNLGRYLVPVIGAILIYLVLVQIQKKPVEKSDADFAVSVRPATVRAAKTPQRLNLQSSRLDGLNKDVGTMPIPPGFDQRKPKKFELSSNLAPGSDAVAELVPTPADLPPGREVPRTSEDASPNVKDLIAPQYDPNEEPIELEVTREESSLTLRPGEGVTLEPIPHEQKVVTIQRKTNLVDKVSVPQELASVPKELVSIVDSATQQVTKPEPTQVVKPKPASLELPTSSMPMELPNGIRRQILEKATYASSLARRGAFASAEEEFLQSIRLIAESLDANAGDRRYTRHFSVAMNALREANDFAPSDAVRNTRIDITPLVATHQTPVLKNYQTEQVSMLTAMQTYYEYAQEHLFKACGGQQIASQVLYGLGKLYSTQAANTRTVGTSIVAKAMVMHQVALATDCENYRSSNELGVLLARYGRLEDAKNLLLHSLSIQRQETTWRNLATVHQRLGETDFQKRAINEIKILQSQNDNLKKSKSITSPIVWVEPKAFGGSAPRPATSQTSRKGSTGHSKPGHSKPGNANSGHVKRGNTNHTESMRTRIAESLDRLKFWK